MKTDYVFRKANDNDKEAILALYHSMLGTEGCTWNENYPGMQEIDEDIENDSLYCLCNSSIIIAAAFTGCSDELLTLKWSENIRKPCDLARICVRRDMQRKGIGKLMLSLIFDDAKKRGFDGIRMLVSKQNVPALALYNKCGFACCGETEMYGIDFYCYERSL